VIVAKKKSETRKAQNSLCARIRMILHTLIFLNSCCQNFTAGWGP
jgi:hypothetical protein